jgi:hypothetical protein
VTRTTKVAGPAPSTGSRSGLDIDWPNLRGLLIHRLAQKRNRPKSSRSARDVALWTTENGSKGRFRPPCIGHVHARSVASTPFRTVSRKGVLRSPYVRPCIKAPIAPVQYPSPRGRQRFMGFGFLSRDYATGLRAVVERAHVGDRGCERPSQVLVHPRRAEHGHARPEVPYLDVQGGG